MGFIPEFFDSYKDYQSIVNSINRLSYSSGQFIRRSTLFNYCLLNVGMGGWLSEVGGVVDPVGGVTWA